MYGYYSQKLSANRLRLCYEIAPPRVKRYLDAEIEFVLDKIKPSDWVLELGCGYGRVLQKLITRAKTVVGIDTSRDSLRLARELLGGTTFCHLLAMNAVALGFRDRQFDLVICIQNGISAFKVDPRQLIEEVMRVTCPEGTVLFSIGIFVKVSRSLRKGGGSMTTVMFGATDEFYRRDNKKAIEVIVEQKAGKKLEEQGSEEPENKTGDSQNANH